MLSLHKPTKQLVENVADVVQGSAQKPIASLREGQNLATRFLDGVANIVIDFRIEDDDSLLRIWLVCHPEAGGLSVEPKFPAYVREQEGEPNDMDRRVLANVGFENRDGIQKRVGLGSFTSIISQRHHDITPPFWWTTGNPRVDASSMRRQNANDGRYGDLSQGDQRFRYPVGPEFWNALLAVRVSVCSYCVGVAPRDGRLKVIDTFVGPFNYR